MKVKKIFFVLFYIVLTVYVVAFSSCAKELNSKIEVYKVTFIQTNGEQIVRDVVNGQVSVPKINDKRGYAGNWSIDDFSSVSQDVKVYAEYNPITYTVLLDLNGGVILDSKSSTLQIAFDSNYKLPVVEKEHCEFVAWKYKDESITGEGVWNIAENVTLTAEYKEIQQFEVRFIDGYKDVVKTVYRGESLEDIPCPTERIGYSAEWDIKSFSNITKNLEVVAKYIPNKYIVTLISNGGNFSDGTSESKSIEVTFGGEYELSLTVKDGFNFLSWKISNNKSVATSGVWNIANDVILTADYVEKTIREVTFIQDGCDDIVRCTEEDSVLTDIPTPQPKSGYTVAWDVIDFENFTGLTVHAVYTPNKYIITLNPDGGVLPNDITEYEVTYHESYKLEIPEKKGYDFIAWKLNEISVVIDGKWEIPSDVELIAEYREKVKHVVRFVQSGQKDVCLNVVDGEMINEEDIPEPKNVDGYDIVWNGDLKNVITKDLVIEAVMTPKTYTASFVVNEEIYKIIKVKYNTELVFPIVDDDEFLYWVTDEITGNLTEKVMYNFDKDITFRACFNSKCNVEIVLKDVDKGKNIPKVKMSFEIKVGEDFNQYLEYPSDVNTQYSIDYYYFTDERGDKVVIKNGDNVKCPNVDNIVIYMELKMQWSDNY